MTVLHDETIERPFDEPPEAPAKPAWGVALKRAWTKFNLDQCSDQAASLTYRSIQSLFPALIALLSLLNIFGDGKKTTNSLVKSIGNILGTSESQLSGVSNFINNVQTTGGGGIALIVGIALALWSASGYVGAFSRALNRIYAVAEGRPVWKLRPWLYLITVIEVILLLIVIAALVATGSVAKEIGSAIGLGSQAVSVWDIAKWPFVAIIVIGIISMLYWATPNVKKTKGSFFSAGAAFAFVVWVILSAILATYFGMTSGASYQKTYGAFAGAIMLMLWLYITNMAMLFGAELDSEVIRTKQLKSGLPAERLVLLPARDTAGIEKQAEKDETSVEAAHKLRMDNMGSADAREARHDAEAGALALGRELDSSEHGNAATPSQPLRQKGHKPLDAGEVRRAQRNQREDDAHGRGIGTMSPGEGSSSGQGSNETRLAKKGSTVAASSSGYDAEAEKAQIDDRRLERRDEALEQFGHNREVRARLEKQEAKQRAAEKAAEKKRQDDLKAAEAKVSREQRWDSVDAVRSQFAPPASDTRDEVMAERESRRAEWRADMREKAQEKRRAEASPQVAHAVDKSEIEGPSLADRPEPTPWRDQVEAERADRRAAWKGEHTRS